LRHSGRQSIPLTLVQRGCTRTTPWLVCGCDRVVRKLYLPPDAHAFACRRCYGLTYASQHESSRLTAFDRMIASRCDLTPRQIRRQKRFFCTGILYWQQRAGVPVPLAEGGRQPGAARTPLEGVLAIFASLLADLVGSLPCCAKLPSRRARLESIPRTRGHSWKRVEGALATHLRVESFPGRRQ
jgi:hypothetical protein